MRSSPFVPVAMVLAWSLTAFVPWWLVVLLHGAVLGLSLRASDAEGVHASVPGVVLGLGRSCFAAPPPAVLFLAPGLLLAVGLTRTLGLSADGTYERGHTRASDWAWAGAFVLVPALSLLAWLKLAQPELGDLHAMIPDVSALAILGVALLFAIFNGLVEELIFRGAMHRSLQRRGLSVAAIVAVQAVAFGLIHYNGFPRGWTGVGLATVYGAMMGALRARTDGLLLPWFAHIGVDLVVFTLVLSTLWGAA